MAQVSATEANRSFSKLLAKVRTGEAVEITVRGKVVARLEPVAATDPEADAERQKDWEAFMERLRNQPVLNLPRGKRDDLYD